MKALIKLLSSHNISRHMSAANANVFDENMRGLKKNELSILNLAEPPAGFVVAEDYRNIEGRGYHEGDFFRRYLLDDFFTTTYMMEPGDESAQLIKTELDKALIAPDKISGDLMNILPEPRRARLMDFYKAVQGASLFELALPEDKNPERKALIRDLLYHDVFNDVYGIVDAHFDFKIRISRNGFSHVILEKMLAYNEHEELFEMVKSLIENKYIGYLPLIVTDLFVRNQDIVIRPGSKKECRVSFLPGFNCDRRYKEKLGKGIFPQHNTYIFTCMPWSVEMSECQQFFQGRGFTSAPEEISYPGIDRVFESVEPKTAERIREFYGMSESGMMLRLSNTPENIVIRKLFNETDIFDLKKNIKNIAFNSNIRVTLNDNLCFVKSRFIDDGGELDLPMHSFIRMMEYLFTISTELETILKNTTLMLEQIAKVNKEISIAESERNWKTIESEIQGLMQKLSRNYRMLPHVRDILVGTTAFKNMEIVATADEIMEVFHLFKTEKCINQNIDEVNSFITHFHTILSREREKRSNSIVSRIFLLLSGLQIPSFVKDLSEVVESGPSSLVALDCVLFGLLICMALYFHWKAIKGV